MFSTINKVVSQTHQKLSEARNVALIKKNIFMYMLLAPALIAVALFCYAPMAGIAIAFKDYNVIKGFGASPWVGLENFVHIFSYPNFLTAIRNTLVYSSFLVFVYFPFPILLAILFNELRNIHFKKIAQTVTYLPHFLSWISVVGFCYSLFALNGPVNDFMANLFGAGYERKNIFLNADNFLAVLFFSHTWKSIGWSSILYLAAIAGIDQGLYEAAALDGCNRFQQVWHVTLPGIWVTCVLVLILAVGNLVNTSFEQVYGFQNVYTQEKTEVINTLVYRQGIQSAQYSLATAFGLIQGLVSLTLVTLANAVSKKISNIGIW